MDSKQISKNISRFFAWFGLNFCSLTVKFIPARFLYAFANNMAAAGYFFAARPRRIALESLEIAFGREKSQKERDLIARESFRDVSKSAVELLFLMERPQLLKQRVRLCGEEHLQQALAKGKGVILVSAHFGNFPLLMAKMSLEGYKIGGIMRPMRDSRVEEFFLKKRNGVGVKTIYSQPRNTCVNQTLEALRNNEIVFIPLDQNFGTGGIFVDFFGQKAATATGPVVLAKRTKASLLPCFIIRQPDDTQKIIFEPALELIEAADPEQSVALNIQKLTNIIEAYIRRYPAEWGWNHRRWKSKPG